jgi:hypothetical protein
MASFDSSKSNIKSDISPNVGALPYVEIDQSTLVYGPSAWQGYGTVVDAGISYRIQFTYYGKFNYSSQNTLRGSSITGFNLAGPDLGSFLASGLGLNVGDFLGDPNAAGRAMLSGNDLITGSRFGETIEPYLGVDTVYAGEGNDRLVGGYGVDRMYGQGGEDTFVVRQNAGPRWLSKKSLPKDGFPLDAKIIRTKGRKDTLYLVDTDYISSPDFELTRDLVNYEGISADSVTVESMDVFGGFATGIGFFQGDTLNLLAYFPNISMPQYEASGMFEI